ncbi:glycosyltransferase [Pimelobacter simplex]|uniref:glycosyltransferase n=1 Tax=Nocardioides simplex TaxID=2045 RepID=UPI0021501396|nr:glycosyltransferase [Pimelobacter simplex]UUW87334.1 glycosyltransferase [Pimelobacter simplex]
MSQLRVCVVQAGGVLGGAERWQLHLADATDRLDLTVVALGDGPAAAQWTARGHEVRVLPAERSAAGIARSQARLLPHLRRIAPDVVVAHGVKAGLVTAPVARLLGVPVVWVRHDASFSGRVVALLDALTDGQVSTSSWLTEGRSPGNALVLPPPRRELPLARPAARARLGVDLAEGRLLLGMGTRLTAYKGVEDAVRALAEPGAAGWELAVAGIADPAEPGERDRLTALATTLGVGARVRFLGEVPDFGRIVTAFDAVAVLTRPTPAEPWVREAFGMAALEAVTGGVPVVAVPPVDEVAGDGAVVVAPGRPDAVAAALARLADDEARRGLGEAATRRAGAFADAAEAAGTFVDFLAALAHRPGAGRDPEGPPISIVTTVLDDRAALGSLLGALLPQLGPDDELVVVDGGSTDGTAELLADLALRDPRVRLLVEPGAGISQGRNLGIAAATHDAIACTDAGCAPVPDWLGALRRAFDRHPEIGLWTGTYSVEADRAWEHALAAVGYPMIEELARPTPLVRVYGRFLGRSFDPTMPTGRSVAFRREAWRAAGGFPEDLATGEDVLFGRSVVAAGARAAMVRDAEVVWAQRPTFRANLTMYRRYGEGSGYSLDRRLLSRDLARVAAYGVAAVVAVRGGRRSRGLAAAGGAAYLSLPVARALRGPAPVRTVALVPGVAAARDLAKAYGAVSAALRGRPTS